MWQEMGQTLRHRLGAGDGQPGVVRSALTRVVLGLTCTILSGTMLTGTVLTGLVVVGVDTTRTAQAQSPPRPQIEVSSTVSAGAGETRLAIAITRTEGMPRGSFIRIRGLPADSTMSEGFAIAPSLWAVPLNSLPNLKIRLSSPLKADVPLIIALATVDGDVLAEARAMLRPPGSDGTPKPPPPSVVNTAPPKAAMAIVAPPPVPARPPAAIPDPSEPPPPPPDPWTAAEQLPLTPDQVRALGFITRAREQMAEGNIAVARLLFERAAKAGLAYGALGMAETYDADELARQKVLGMAGDIELARSWYQTAARLGAPEAEQRLKQLRP